MKVMRAMRELLLAGLTATVILGTTAEGLTQGQPTPETCQSAFSGDPDRGWKDPQPTPGEVARRLKEAGCSSDNIDTSTEAGKDVDAIYQELMHQAEKDLKGAPNR